MRRTICTLIAILIACAAAEAVKAQQGRGFRGGRQLGTQDNVAGASARGSDSTFAADRNDFHFLLAHHDAIRREVTELENGVETITESDDPDVAAMIQKHVAAMYERVEQDRPIRMRDPLFAEIFRHAEKIELKVVKTSQGVRVTETSQEAYAVKLIQAHARVVSDFVKYGFAEAQKSHPEPTGDH